MAALSLGSCGTFGGGSVEPDTLAKWVVDHAEDVVKPDDITPDSGRSIGRTDDKKGVVVSKPKEGDGFALHVYLVPVAALDAGLEADLRKQIFPGGTATAKQVNQGSSSSDTSDKKVSEAEFDKLYYEFIIVPKSALCGADNHPCDAVQGVALLGTLKGNAPFGKGSRKLFAPFQLVTDTDKFVDDQIKDAQATCGFDPKNDRVPHHVAMGCRGMMMLRYAAEHGFGVDRNQLMLMPVTTEALTLLTREALRESLYKDGSFKGSLVIDGRSI
jgi:hypothetical protein